LRESPPELVLALTEYEDNRGDRSKGDWTAFTAIVASRGFRGHTHFWVSRDDLEAFETALRALDEHLTGVAELVCGVGTDEYLRVRVVPYGGSGRLTVQAMLAEPRDPIHQRVQAGFVILPNELTAFRAAMRRLLESRAGEARLAGDPEQGV